MTGRNLLSAAGLAAFIAVWELVGRSGLVSPTLLPPPSEIPIKFISELRLGIWQDSVAASLEHYLIGLFVGSAAGVCVGGVAALFPKVDAAQAWLARLLRPIPPLAWIPFAIIWFGVTQAAAAFIIAIGVFWINYFTAYESVRRVDKDMIELAEAFGHRSLPDKVLNVVMPASAPGVLAGLRAGIGQGWMTVIAAEIFGVAGIGQRMMEAAGLLATSVVLVYMATIALLYAISDALFVLVQKRILRWQP